MYKSSVFTLLLIFISLSLQSQNINWQNSIGGSKIEWLNSIEYTSDGNYLVGGYSFSGISGDKTVDSRGNNDFWILKIDKDSGNIIWQKTIGGRFGEFASTTKQTSDGGYIIGGYSNSNISGDKTENSRGNDDYWVVKLDSDRNVIWDKTYGGNDVDRLWTLIETADGGYLLGGESKSEISGDKTENSRGDYDMWILKIDANGAIEWQKTFGGNDIDNAKSLIKALDGGYIIAGSSFSNISGEKTENSRGIGDFWILKIDISGNIVWQKTIGGNNGDYATAIHATSDGNYILGGISGSNISGEKTENSVCNSVDSWVLKLDVNGDIIWQKTIGGSSTEDFANVRETLDHGYIVGSMSYSDISGSKTENSRGDRDYWLVKLDSQGNIEQDKTVGGNGMDQLTDVIPAADGSFVAGGWSLSNATGDKTEDSNGEWDYWILDLTLNTSQENSAAYQEIAVCSGQNMQLNAEVGISYSWSGPNNYESTEQNPIINNISLENVGFYNVTITTEDMCSKTVVYKIVLNSSDLVQNIDDIIACDFNHDGFADFDLLPIVEQIREEKKDVSITFFDESGNSLFYSYVNPIPYHETTIKVRVAQSNNLNCYGESSFKLIVKDCMESITAFPEFFSPNNDGYNDFWVVNPEPNFPIVSLYIYNRYGKLLKQLDPQNLKWSGIYNGKPMPADDYWYRAVNSENEILSGHFSLIR